MALQHLLQLGPLAHQRVQHENAVIVKHCQLCVVQLAITFAAVCLPMLLGLQLGPQHGLALACTAQAHVGEATADPAVVAGQGLQLQPALHVEKLLLLLKLGQCPPPHLQLELAELQRPAQHGEQPLLLHAGLSLAQEHLRCSSADSIDSSRPDKWWAPQPLGAIGMLSSFSSSHSMLHICNKFCMGMQAFLYMYNACFYFGKHLLQQARSIPASMPIRSTTGELRNTTLNANKTHGRYGAVNVNIPRKLKLTY